ncbi:glycerol-3-phosphate 1-O-acyltransferase PlsB [Pseudobacteriovorax antillogorgiicola]|uniref:Glycerol-3-phosphate acyltransferase n=1 Tax=Pseudobacteriovorax antillogorgiicola TaxID=1513793 RepID=A0A1Y6C514_9BACT|nr:glycerol-3-phosphate 1-O-acyltransferase PlsB [Pseudobacteriovorax antillogorgiicola]TCS49483.1 glycerol-3-phosphate acyltransferase [Pseudobacteriovorax antillogorgiicola]SMF46084.1 glycerol-3-phosphate acyltransferase [Pseudobacteriovorax antillogorgiicola]
MSFVRHQISQLWTLLLKPMMLWIVSRANPETPGKEFDSKEALIVYILPKKSYLDRMVLENMCRKHKLPIPEYTLDVKKKRSATVAFLSNPGLFRNRVTRKSGQDIKTIVELQKKFPDRKIHLVPVSPFWGKNPGRGENSIWKLLFNDDESAGRLQRFLIVLFQGRNNVVYFSTPFSFDDIARGETDVERLSRKTRRVLRVHFRRQRNTVLGKELYIREQVVTRVAKGKMVRTVIDHEVKTKSSRSTARSLETKARRYTRELAADQMYTMVRVFEIVLGRLWNKLFDGVEIQNLENVRTLAEKDFEIVYVPTHRSHLDYLLTSYTIYQSGMPSPHIAAGINLNFWPLGWFLRRAGAFFIRRSFKGNRLYTAVVNEYIHYLLTHGYPMTFFPEGGRSRTGKLLPLKTGMLAMIVHSFVRSSQRPVALVPVYLGYDKVMEVGSYMSELSGSSKKKESIFALLKARKLLRSYYGKAYVSYGEPIVLSEYLDQHQPQWREVGDEVERPDWLPRLVQNLGYELSVRMNQTAVMSPISMVSLSLLSSWQKALPKSGVLSFIDTLMELQNHHPYHRNLKYPTMTAEQVLEQVGKLKMHSEFKHAGGDVLHLSETESILISYYRNNVVHLIAIPSLIARFFKHQERVPLTEIAEGCSEIYPFLKEEFYLSWPESEVVSVVEGYADVMVKVGLLMRDGPVLVRPVPSYDQSENLSILGNSLGLTFERYTITAALLARHTKEGYVDSKAFEMQCQKMAQRLAILNGVNNPEFVEKSFVAKHVALLKNKGLLKPQEDGKLLIDPKVSTLARNAMKLLSYDARHSIDRIFAGK